MSRLLPSTRRRTPPPAALDPFDGPALVAWLEDNRAPSAAVAAVSRWLGRQRGAQVTLDPSAIEALLFALLVQSTQPLVSRARIEALCVVAGVLGWGEEHRAAWIAERLRITEERLRAFGALELPLGARDREIKTAHRRAAKSLHPDRLGHASLSEQRDAGRRLAELTVARDLLLGDEGIVLDGSDDLTLGDPSSFEPDEDAPTVIWDDEAEIRPDGDAPTNEGDDDLTLEFL